MMIEIPVVTVDQLREAARAFFNKAAVYGDDGEFQVTAWTPDAMDAARRLYELAFVPTDAELRALATRHPSDVTGSEEASDHA